MPLRGQQCFEPMFFVLEIIIVIRAGCSPKQIRHGFPWSIHVTNVSWIENPKALVKRHGPSWVVDILLQLGKTSLVSCLEAIRTTLGNLAWAVGSSTRGWYFPESNA